jgi:hypothetical protein
MQPQHHRLINQTFIRDVQPTMQSHDLRQRQWAFSIQNLTDATFRANKRFQVFTIQL